MKNLLFTCLLALLALPPLDAAAQREEKVLAESELTKVMMPTSTNHDYQSSNWISTPHKATLSSTEKKMLKSFPFAGFMKLVREEDKTVLHCYVNTDGDEVNGFWLGGDDTYLVDVATGTRYQARGSYDPQLWNHNIRFNAKSGELLDFPIAFPPLPATVKEVRLYGVPAWGIHGKTFRIDTRYVENTYDKAPNLRVPELESPAINYNPDIQDSYSVYKNAHLVAPMPEYTMALWLTPETTYLAIVYEQNWAKEYWGFQPGTKLVDNTTGKEYRLRRVQGLPMDEIFFIHGVSGDMVAFVMEFDPLPLTATKISYREADGKPFKAWGANWIGKRIDGLSVDRLRKNQDKLKYYQRTVVK